MHTSEPDNQPTPQPITLDDIVKHLDTDAVDNYARDVLAEPVTLIRDLCRLHAVNALANNASTHGERQRAEAERDTLIASFGKNARKARRELLNQYAENARTVIENKEIDHATQR